MPITNKTWKPWTPGALRALHEGSAKKTSVRALCKMLKRSETAVRQKAREQGWPMGPYQRGVSNRKRRAPRKVTVT